MHRKELIKTYLLKVKAANKEATKKEAFKDLLNRLYPGEKEIERIIDKISSGAEQTVQNMANKNIPSILTYRRKSEYSLRFRHYSLKQRF
jgi:hypothetical protein